VLVVAWLVFMPMDVPAQCEQQVYARANPQLCDVMFPFPISPSGGGSDGGGILGTIGRVLGGLTGGLL
jgi:hypothetical protein